MNVLLAVVVYSIMYAGGVPEYIGPMAIEEVAAASPAEAAGLQVGDTFIAAV